MRDFPLLSILGHSAAAGLLVYAAALLLDALIHAPWGM